MRIADLNGKRVCILGFGKEGQAMFSAIEKNAPNAHVTIADQNRDPINQFIANNSPKNPTLMKTGITTQSGEVWLREIDSFDVIIKSPGIPMNPELENVSTKITNSTQIFLEEAAARGAIVIGVTGSKGKSTTASLIHSILKEAGRNTYLVGNIGEPAIAHIDDSEAGVIFVLEMSSYQLAQLTTSPHIAVITSFFPEHLDYHGTLENYREAKSHIAKFQGENDVVVFNENFPDTAWIASQSKGKKIGVTEKDAPLMLEETWLLGRHNLGNIALAWTVARELGIDKTTAIVAFKTFQPLPHRLQSLGIHHGMEWIDDAISTTPESTIAALDALGDRVETIILGGQDRGYDFASLADRLKRSSVKTVILFPGSGPAIRKAIENAKATIKLIDAGTMEEAVTHARKSQIPNPKSPIPSPQSPVPIVLLSTASPSYNMFKNFEEKGDKFRECILKQ